MRFHRMNVALVPRNALNCLDLAIRFYGRFLVPILKLWAVFALPACLLVYLLCYYFLIEMKTAVTVAYFASSPLGVLLTWNSALFSFGETPGIGSLRRQFQPRMIPLMLRCLFDRVLLFIGPALVFYTDSFLTIMLGILYLFFPGIWLALRNGFRVEHAALKQIGIAGQEENSHDHRTKDLISTHFSTLCWRGAWTLFFCYILTCVLFITFDYLCSTLLDINILIGQMPYAFDPDNIGDPISNALLLLSTDPRVLTVFTGFILLIYPIGRLAWFFTYLDLRVRYDCWDMELRMAEVSQRLTRKEVAL
ncbi:MAG: hypothetical protein KDA70_04575 [Planctomycetaceae bacterium]|nr:hypothetical protein [Planctomycetaceae bacterium]